MHPIRKLLFKTDPYEDYPVRESKLNGWNSRHEKLGEILWSLNASKEDCVVEIGSWLGASALFMAENTNAHIICIDTWQGSQEMWSDQADETRYEALKIEHGQPTIMRDFMSNVIKENRQDQITPMPMPSSIALKLLGQWKIWPKLIYVDGDHSVSGVTHDLDLAMRLGPLFICGDDYLQWPTVARAVRKWFGFVNVETDGFWWCDVKNRPQSAAVE